MLRKPVGFVKYPYLCISKNLTRTHCLAETADVQNLRVPLL